MKLLTRSALIFVSTFSFLLVSFYFIISYIVIDKYQQIEESNISDTIQSGLSEIQDLKRSLKKIGREWSNWDDMYTYIQDRNKDFPKSNFIYELLENLNIDIFLLYDTKREIVNALGIDHSSESVTPISDSILKDIKNNELLFKLNKDEAQNGMIEIDKEIYFITSHNILKSNFEGTPAGTLIFGTKIGRETELGISYKLRTQAYFIRFNKNEITQYLNEGIGAQFISHNIFTKRFDKNTIHGYSILNDIHNNEILLFKIQKKRSIYQTGIYTAFVTLIYLGLSGFIFLFIIFILIDKCVLSKLKKLEKDLETISSESEEHQLYVTESSYAHGKGKDEIANLAENINSMLRRLYAARINFNKAKNEAIEANKTKLIFVAKITHELRTPIHGITGMLKILEKNERSESKKSYLKIAQSCAGNLLHTINDVLDFSKAESTKISLSYNKICLRVVITDAIRIVSPRYDENPSVELLCDVHPDVPENIIFDADKLKQIIINLLSNAIKFTEAGYVKLTVTFRKDPDDSNHEISSGILNIIIQDTGIGIPQASIQEIFEPFKQIDENFNKTFKGTGLGLTIIKQIIETSNGNIDVKSTVGKGTTFTIILPIEYTSLYTLKLEQLQQKQVYLIDTTKHLGNFLKYCLERYQVYTSNLTCDSLFIDGYINKALLEELRGKNNILIVNQSLASDSAKENDILRFIEEIILHPHKIKIYFIVSASDLSTKERIEKLQNTKIITLPFYSDSLIELIESDLVNQLKTAKNSPPEKISEKKLLNILIAEDLATNRIIIEDIIQELGHNFTTVTNGLELVQEVKLSYYNNGKSFYDLILTDINMPILDGMAAVKQIRKFEEEFKENTIKNSSGNSTEFHFKSLPIAAVTANAFNYQSEELLHQGFNFIINKPIDPEEITRLLNNISLSITPKIPELLEQEATSNESMLEDHLIQNTTEMHSRETKVYELNIELEKLFIANNHPSINKEPDNNQENVVIHFQNVYQRSGKSLKRTIKLFASFLKSYNVEMDKLLHFASEEDLEEIRFYAHAVKNMLLDVGADDAASKALEIEQNASKALKLDYYNLCWHLFEESKKIKGVLSKVVENYSNSN
jgi:signal transduction histidine kinase/CheY-like chemotaxis protein